MSKNPKTIFLIAGEDSGDTLGAELINSIRNQPDGKDIELIGAGGQKMRKAGGLRDHGLSGFVSSFNLLAVRKISDHDWNLKAESWSPEA